MKRRVSLAASLMAGLVCGGAAHGQSMEAMPDTYDGPFAAAMANAQVQAARNSAPAVRAMSAESRAAFEIKAPLALASVNGAAAATDFASLASTTVGAGLSGVASESAVDLKAVGAANERAAKSMRQARWGRRPIADEKGYYFTWSQTWDYAHTQEAERNGLFPVEYYRDLRCRAAPRIGPFAQKPAWTDWSLRVCPDEQGKYRPAI